MKVIKKTILISLSLFVILWGIKFTCYNLRIEGYSGLILEWFFPNHDTVFSENYSDKGFLEVEKGMTEAEVLNILGEPLTRWIPKDNHLGLQYSESEESTHYRLRQIHLTKGKVIDVIAYYYID